MNSALKNRLKSFLDRLCNDSRSGTMFEADADALREAISMCDLCHTLEKELAEVRAELAAAREAIKTLLSKVPNIDYQHDSQCMSERGWGDGPCNCGAKKKADQFVKDILYSIPSYAAKYQALVEACELLKDVWADKPVVSTGVLHGVVDQVCEAVRQLKED